VPRCPTNSQEGRTNTQVSARPTTATAPPPPPPPPNTRAAATFPYPTPIIPREYHTQ